jgi:two-component system, NtrC family, response regulator AtoC
MKDFTEIFFAGSPRMVKIKTLMEDIAKTDINILIKGESGTGKNVIAKGIHQNSPRQAKPFIKVNCAAIPRELLESELFGFEKGAFTGAHTRKPGKFELANGGTILLNEISEMDLSTQAKLLQVLQDGVFPRLGGEQDIRVSICVITTTKDHIEKSVLEGTFREDLFYRINALSITVPPLRERREQIPALVDFYFNYYQSKYAKKLPLTSQEILKSFKEYDWPGNIRELENIIKRMVIQGEMKSFVPAKSGSDTIRPEKTKPLPADKETVPSPSEAVTFDLKGTGKKAAEMAEKEFIQKALKHTHWNRKEAARLLKVSYKALLYKIQKYNLETMTNTKSLG